jgi:glucan phosphoethanolaminetransferase (alkaline phosphatase superfamily)
MQRPQACAAGHSIRNTFVRLLVPFCYLVSLLSAVYPFSRAFYRVEVSYNEGWNVYNAATVASHRLLYPAMFGWTSVNYPMLSFVLFAQLHRITNDYLFTARILSLVSLLICCLLVGLIVRCLTGSAHPAWRCSLLPCDLLYECQYLCRRR